MTNEELHRIAIDMWIRICMDQNLKRREEPGYIPDNRHMQTAEDGGWIYHKGQIVNHDGYYHVFITLEDPDASVGYFIALIEEEEGERFGMFYNETINGVATWIEGP